MKPRLKEYFDAEIKKHNQFVKVANHSEAWQALARAHILGQFYSWPHLVVHWLMFCQGLRTLNMNEIIGQIPRLLLAIPGSLTGKAPRGNTGLSNVGIFQPMDIPQDLQDILE